MRIVLPDVQYQNLGGDLAPRLSGLDGKVVGFIDGWGERHEDGSFGMYPLYRELWEKLRASTNVKDLIWVKKPNISQPVEESTLNEFLDQVDVVVNGQAA